MTDAEATARSWSTPTLPPRRYRWLDRATKLAGVALVAAGLNAGGASAEGIALAGVGTALALTTVFLREDPNE